MSAGLGIYDTMQYILPPIATWCVGQACSMGSLLLAAGEPGMRHSLPNARIMIHQPSGGVQVSETFQFMSISIAIIRPKMCLKCVLRSGSSNGYPNTSRRDRKTKETAQQFVREAYGSATRRNR